MSVAIDYTIDYTEDAIFLSGKLHGCEDELYVVYFNPNGNIGKGCFEINILNADEVLANAEKVFSIREGTIWDEGNDFIVSLYDEYQYEIQCADFGTEAYEDIMKQYPSADFISGRDGDSMEEARFIINWAKNRVKERDAND